MAQGSLAVVYHIELLKLAKVDTFDIVCIKTTDMIELISCTVDTEVDKGAIV